MKSKGPTLRHRSTKLLKVKDKGGSRAKQEKSNSSDSRDTQQGISEFLAETKQGRQWGDTFTVLKGKGVSHDFCICKTVLINEGEIKSFPD